MLKTGTKSQQLNHDYCAGLTHEIKNLLAIDGFNCFRDREGDKALIGYP